MNVLSFLSYYPPIIVDNFSSRCRLSLVVILNYPGRGWRILFLGIFTNIHNPSILINCFLIFVQIKCMGAQYFWLWIWCFSLAGWMAIVAITIWRGSNLIRRWLIRCLFNVFYLVRWICLFFLNIWCRYGPALTIYLVSLSICIGPLAISDRIFTIVVSRWWHMIIRWWYIVTTVIFRSESRLTSVMGRGWLRNYIFFWIAYISRIDISICFFIVIILNRVWYLLMHFSFLLYFLMNYRFLIHICLSYWISFNLCVFNSLIRTRIYIFIWLLLNVSWRPNVSSFIKYSCAILAWSVIIYRSWRLIFICTICVDIFNLSFVFS